MAKALESQKFKVLEQVNSQVFCLHFDLIKQSEKLNRFHVLFLNEYLNFPKFKYLTQTNYMWGEEKN